MPRVGGPNVFLEGFRLEEKDPMRVTSQGFKSIKNSQPFSQNVKFKDEKKPLCTANALGQKLEIIISKPAYFRNAVKKIRKILGLTFPPKNIGPLHNIFLDTNSKIALI